MWFFSTLHILKFNALNSYLCLGVLALISIGIIIKEWETKYTLKLIKQKIRPIIIVEIAFLFVFLIACHVKSYKSEINGLEKFMDYGFMNIMDKSDFMPSEDMWFSGEKINYYYMGQFYATFLNKLAGTNISYGYNLALATIFTLAVISIFIIAYNLLQQTVFKNNQKEYSIIGGTISTIAVNIAGNFHYTIYGLILPMWYKIVGIVPEQNNRYYFWDSTRFIGYNPETNDKTIHEFPMYSYVVGDLHAHLINIIFVITLLAILLSHLIKNKEEKIKKFYFKNVIKPEVLWIGFLVGIFKMTNYWDFPIYTVVSTLMFLFLNLRIYEKKSDSIKATIVQTLIILLLPIIVSMPFMVNFEKISSAIKFVASSTPIWQLAILWGLPIFMILLFFVFTIIDQKKLAEKKGKSKSKIFDYITNLSISDIFVLIIGFSAIGLVIAPEIVYVKDVYEAIEPRANTMFKLTYQSFIMFGICFGYIITKLLYQKKDFIKNIAGVVLTVLFVTTALYPITAVSGWFGNIFDFSKPKTLNGEAFFETFINTRKENEEISMKDEYEVIKWIRENIKDNVVVLEEQGEDFVYSNQISTFTAKPTVCGWGGHEWLWRSTNSSTGIPESVNERINDVFKVYTSDDKNEIDELVKKYNISYVVFGVNERIRYNSVTADDELPSEKLFKEIGQIVFETNISEQKLPTYIIKLK